MKKLHVMLELETTACCDIQSHIISSFQVYNGGLRHMDLTFILTSLCIPVISVLALTLSLPYIFARSIVPAFGEYAAW